jgi:hypothetical protein
MNAEHLNMVLAGGFLCAGVVSAWGIGGASLDLLAMMDAADQVEAAIVATPPSVRRTGARPIDLTPGAPVRVTVIGEEQALLRCDGGLHQPQGGGATVAFGPVPTTGCALSLGPKSRAYEPVYPGDHVTCRLVDGVTACEGGLADAAAAALALEAEADGAFFVDGVPSGRELKVRPGAHVVRFAPVSGPPTTWTLHAQPHERVTIHFPAPLVTTVDGG